jgi:antitoxin component YwqK of YwqJK toxin-antitoxin module
MKHILILILSLCVACSKIIEQGFTNKAEAKNLMVNGKREGKWIVYEADMPDSVGDGVTYLSTHVVPKDSNAEYYSLIIYKNGKPDGIKRRYYMSGKLQSECKYIKGKINDTTKMYYESGGLSAIMPIKNDNKNGVEKWYYENGKLKQETTYINGKEGGTKHYDENGNEIKQ